jgi:flagellar protein FliS
MYQSANDSYLESRILTADPVELIGLLYQAATAAVRNARRYLQEGDIMARSRAITRAHDILAELTGALDHGRGGEISQRLAGLYAYMQGRLLTANLERSDDPLAEVLGLLATLTEGWDGVKQQTASRPAASGTSWMPPPEPAEAYAGRGWSL